MTRHWITWDYLSHHIQQVPSPSSRFPVHLAVVPLYKTCRDLIDTLGPLVQFVHIEPDQLHISRMHQENTSFAFYYFSCFYHFSCTFYFTFLQLLYFFHMILLRLDLMYTFCAVSTHILGIRDRCTAHTGNVMLGRGMQPSGRGGSGGSLSW